MRQASKWGLSWNICRCMRPLRPSIGRFCDIRAIPRIYAFATACAYEARLWGLWIFGHRLRYTSTYINKVQIHVHVHIHRHICIGIDIHIHTHTFTNLYI